MTAFEAVLFDCDGVLVDSESITNRVLCTMLNESGWPISTEECLREFIGKTVRSQAALIEARTGWRGFGVLPFFADAAKLPAEDALDLPKGGGAGGFKVACLAFSRIANFDDLDPLAQEPGVALRMIQPGQAIPGDTDLVILPGSKSTRGDLAFLRAQGWDIDLAAHVRRGGHVLGVEEQKIRPLTAQKVVGQVARIGKQPLKLGIVAGGQRGVGRGARKPFQKVARQGIQRHRTCN